MQRPPTVSSLDLFEFVDARREPIGVRAFNPTVADHGYELGGAVLQVNVEDMPFLFDSISSELVAEDLHVRRVLHPVVGLSAVPTPASSPWATPARLPTGSPSSTMS